MARAPTLRVTVQRKPVHKRAVLDDHGKSAVTKARIHCGVIRKSRKPCDLQSLGERHRNATTAYRRTWNTNRAAIMIAPPRICSIVNRSPITIALTTAVMNGSKFM